MDPAVYLDLQLFRTDFGHPERSVQRPAGEAEV